jgi:ATP-binding cassette subfamily B protein
VNRLRLRLRPRIRLLGAVVGSTYRAAPLLAATTSVAASVSALASISYSIGYRVMVDAALRGDAAGVALGAVLVAVLFALMWVLGIATGMYGSVLTDRVSLYLSDRIARLVARSPGLSHFEDADTRNEIEQLTQNRRTLSAAWRQITRIWQTGLRGGGILVLLATIYPPVLVVPLLGVLPALADKRAARVAQAADDALADDRRLLDELFTLATTADAAKELRTYGVTHALARRHTELSERIRSRTVRAALRSAAWEAGGWLLYALGFVAAIVVLVLRAAHGHVSAGQIVMAVSLLRRAQSQVSSATDTAGSFATAVRTGRRLLWLEDYVSEATTAAITDTAPERLADGIRLSGVEFAYPGADRPVLRDVDLRLPAGATVAIVGENGAGKTTLVKLLLGMYQPTNGQVLIDGVDLAGVDLAEWRRRTTGTFQDFARFAFAVRETVGVGDLPRLDDDDAVRTALSRGGANAVVERLPQGLDTLVGNRFTGGRELSGGEWQRLALARGSARDAPLLTVLDEPTASLDAVTEANLFARYADAAARGDSAARGGITLLISHRFSTVRIADLIVVLHEGRVVEFGGHEELLASGGRYAELYRLQARGYLGDNQDTLDQSADTERAGA